MLRLSTFDAEPGGGSLADVVLDASEMTDTQMERIAARVSYAETALIVDAFTDRITVTGTGEPIG